MIDYQVIKNWPFGALRQSYDQRDVILYALGCGLGADPMDERQLDFVYEKNLKVMPSMAAVLGTPGSWWRLPGTGANYLRSLHAEQDVAFHAPLACAATVIGLNRVTHLHDRGEGKGVLAGLVRDICAEDGSLIARAKRIEVLRDDGGFAARGGPNDEAPPRLEPLPEQCGSPDIEILLPTVAQAGLIYRLSGDPNPLHADPEVARAAGFARPIFHGLGSFGVAAHAILRACCDYAPEALTRLALRFTAPVYPGETFRFHIWKNDSQSVRFRAWAEERKLMVLDKGLAEFK